MSNHKKIIKYPNSSFYWGMRILKKEQRYAMFTIYSFCKKADSIADNKDLPSGSSSLENLEDVTIDA